MKVRLTSDQLGPNPNFDYTKPQSETNCLNVVVPAGTVIEDPEAHYLVINEQAEPIDDEAKQAYARYLQRREQALMGNRPVIPMQSTPVAPAATAPETSPVESVVKNAPVPGPLVKSVTPHPRPDDPMAFDVAVEYETPPATPAKESFTTVPAPLAGLQDLPKAG